MQTPITPSPVYITFSGVINQDSLARIFQSFSGVTQRAVNEVHLLFQSQGGHVADGIALFNFFKAIPIDLNIYNTGTVGSIAVLSYLAGRHRFVSRHATFLIHKTIYPIPTPANAAAHRALADNMVIDDNRIEAIVKALTTIPAERWLSHASEDVIFQAQEAVECGIADAIREFQVPSGGQVFNI